MTLKRKTALVALVASMAICAATLVLHNAPDTSIPSLVPGENRDGDSPGFLAAQRAAERLRNEIARNPDDASSYVGLARLFLQEARLTGDHHAYIPAARKLLERAALLAPDDFQQLQTRASLLMTLHRFAEAKTLAEQAVAANPRSPAAHAVLVDALVELGDYSAAVKASDRLMGMKPDLRGYARVSYLREIYGDTPGAIAAMLTAADAGIPGSEERSWALCHLANLFLRSGKPDTAAYIYHGILEERHGYAFALAGLASVAMTRHQPDSALTLLTRALSLRPDHAFMEQLADVYESMGRHDDAQRLAGLVLDSFAQHERDGWNIDREFALFSANHKLNPEEVLRRARSDYESRPDNIDALTTYAWVLQCNGRSEEALPLIQHALRLHTRSAVLHYYAGVIFGATGNPVTARSELIAAVATDGFIHPLYLPDALSRIAHPGRFASNQIPTPQSGSMP